MGRLSFLYLGVLLLSVALASSFTTPTEYFSDADAAALKSLLLSTQKADGSFGSLHDTHYAVSALNQINADVPNTKVCAFVKEALKHKGHTAASLWHAVSLVDLLKCTDAKVDQPLITLLENEVKSDSLTNIYHALSSMALLKAKGHTFSPTATSQVVTAIAQLGGADGLFKDDTDAEESTAYHAGLAFHSLAILKNHFTISADDNEQVDTIVEGATAVFDSAIVEDSVYEFSDPSRLHHLRATSTVLTGLDALTGAGYDLGVNSEQLAGVAQYLILHKHVSNSHDAHYLLQGLHTLVKNNFKQSPLVLSLPKKSVLASATAKGEEGLLQVRVTDVFGHAATKARVYVVKAFNTAQPATVILQNQEATPVASDSTLYSFNFLATKPDQGFYTFEFSVTPANKNSTFFAEPRVTRNVKVVVTAEVTDVTIHVADSAAEEEDTEFAIPVHYPKQLDEVLRANFFQHLFLSFRVRVAGKPVTAQQAFVIFTNEETKEQAIFVANRQGKKYKLSLGLSANIQAFNAHSGKYSILLVVGDSFIQNPISWQLGSVQLNFGKHAVEVPAPSNSTRAPELHHTFNPPAKRPRSAISLIFTIAVLSPLLLLFIGLGYVRANIYGFPTGGLSFLSAVGFLGCIGALMALNVVYFLYLNMIQTLGYLALIGIPTIFIGHQALKHLADQRLAAEDAKKTK